MNADEQILMLQSALATIDRRLWEGDVPLNVAADIAQYSDEDTGFDPKQWQGICEVCGDQIYLQAGDMEGGVVVLWFHRSTRWQDEDHDAVPVRATEAAQ